MASNSLEVSRYLGVGGCLPVFVSEDVIVSAAGNCLAHTSVRSGKQHIVRTLCKRGINVLASTVTDATLVYSSACENPVILVENEGKILAELKNGADLQYAAVNISRDGNRVVGVGAELKQEIIIWDVKSQSQIAKSICGEPCSKVTFSPTDSSLICCSGPTEISFWQLKEGVAGVELIEIGREKREGGYRSHCWGSKENVVAISNKDGYIVDLNPFGLQNGQELITKSVDLKEHSGFHAWSIVLIKDILIVGCDDGMVRWMTESTLSIVNGEQLGEQNVEIVGLSLCPRFHSCLGLGANGSQYVFAADPDSRAEAVRVTGFHKGSIVGIASLNSVRNASSLVATIGKDSTFRVWDLERSSSCPLVEQQVFVDDQDPSKGLESPVSISSSAWNPLVAVGNLSGSIHFNCTTKNKGSISTVQVTSLAAFGSPVTMLEYNRNGTMLSAASRQSGTVCVFRVATAPPTMPGQRVASLAAVVEFPETFPLSLAWDSDDLVIITDTKDDFTVASVHRVKIPTNLTESETVQISPQPCGSLDKLKKKCIGGMLVLGSGRLCASVSHKPGTVEIFHGSPDYTRAPFNWTCPDQQGSPWCFAWLKGTSVFATGGTDGSVCLWQDGENATTVCKNVVSFTGSTSMVTSLSFSPDGKYLVGGHLDGGLTVFAVTTQSGSRPVSYTTVDMHQLQTIKAKERLSEAAIPDSNTPPAPKTESAKWKQRAQDILNLEFDKKRQDRKKRISSLQTRLFQLLENNEQVPELEKLDRDEFVIDVAGKEDTCAKNQEAANQLRAKIEREIKGRELIFSRIKKECWDTAETSSKEIHALDKDLKVRNFPIPKKTPEQKRQLARVVQLRSTEVREMRRANAAAGPATSEENDGGGKAWRGRSVIKALPKNVDWIVNAGILEPAFDQDEMLQKQQAAKLAAKGADEGSNGDEKKDDGGNKKDSDAPSGEDAADGEGGNDGKDDMLMDDEVDAVDYENKEVTLLDLLYHPATLRSPFQIRSQLVLLKELQREMMLAFNKRFEKVVEEKEDTVEKIASKYERINEILLELKMDPEPFPNYWHPHENPDNILKVTPEEIGAEKYLSKSERARLQKEEEERKRRELENAKDNLGERALNDMMNGTLEAAKELSLAERTLEKPAWMLEIEYQDMTDEQRKEFDEFEVIYQKFMEEKEKYTKSLELELKKIHLEVGDIMKNFDENIEQLFQSKITTIESVTIQGLYLSRLSLSLLEQEDVIVKQTKTTEEIKTKSKELETLKLGLTKFQVKYEAEKAKLQELQEKDKQMEKALKTQLQEHAAEVGNGEPIDHDTMKILQQIYKIRYGKRRPNSGFDMLMRRDSFIDPSDPRASFKKRGSMRKSLRRSGSSVSNLSMEDSTEESNAETGNQEPEEVSLDPFSHLNKFDEKAKEEQERAKARKPLDREKECPQGLAIEDSIWDMLQTLRLEKINTELKLKKQQAEFQKIHDQYESLNYRRVQIENDLVSLRELFNDLIQKNNSNSQNIELIIRIKQGQDEVKQQPVIKDYSNSLLLSRGVIEKENAEIAALGATKVATMKKMKEFRKSINFMQWEHKYMEQREHDFEEHYTDLHMLRVTRGLQKVIKSVSLSGDASAAVDSSANDQTQKFESKLIKMKKIHQAKMSKISNSLNKVVDKKLTLAEENAQLELRIKELDANVQMRDGVLRARSGVSVYGREGQQQQHGSPVGSGASVAKAKMKQIVTRRRLTDIAIAQSDEIAFLKQELEELRERSFPRFSNPSSQFAEKKFINHPDYNSDKK